MDGEPTAENPTCLSPALPPPSQEADPPASAAVSLVGARPAEADDGPGSLTSNIEILSRVKHRFKTFLHTEHWILTCGLNYRTRTVDRASPQESKPTRIHTNHGEAAASVCVLYLGLIASRGRRRDGNVTRRVCTSNTRIAQLAACSWSVSHAHPASRYACCVTDKVAGHRERAKHALQCSGQRWDERVMRLHECAQELRVNPWVVRWATQASANPVRKPCWLSVVSLPRIKIVLHAILRWTCMQTSSNHGQCRPVKMSRCVFQSVARRAGYARRILINATL